MRQYLDLCESILLYGKRQSTRTGIDTVGIFGAMMQFDLTDGFPILTTKKVLFDTVVDELLWFIRGGHNVKDADAPKRIWDDWASADGELGRIYGVEWRSWRGFSRIAHDQLQMAIARVKSAPNTRRNLVSAWNPSEIEEGNTNFPPCHVLFQFKVSGDGKRLDLAMYQRSCDMALGVPFNISSYALLLSLVANECGLVPGVFTHFLADAHIYVNHIDTMKTQLNRQPYLLPSLVLTPRKPVVDMTKGDIHLEGYVHDGFLKYEVAI